MSEGITGLKLHGLFSERDAGARIGSIVCAGDLQASMHVVGIPFDFLLELRDGGVSILCGEQDPAIGVMKSGKLGGLLNEFGIRSFRVPIFFLHAESFGLANSQKELMLGSGNGGGIFWRQQESAHGQGSVDVIALDIVVQEEAEGFARAFEMGSAQLEHGLVIVENVKELRVFARAEFLRGFDITQRCIVLIELIFAERQHEMGSAVVRGLGDELAERSSGGLVGILIVEDGAKGPPAFLPNGPKGESCTVERDSAVELLGVAGGVGLSGEGGESGMVLCNGGREKDQAQERSGDLLDWMREGHTQVSV